MRVALQPPTSRQRRPKVPALQARLPTRSRPAHLRAQRGQGRPAASLLWVWGGTPTSASPGPLHPAPQCPGHRPSLSAAAHAITAAIAAGSSRSPPGPREATGKQMWAELKCGTQGSTGGWGQVPVKLAGSGSPGSPGSWAPLEQREAPHSRKPPGAAARPRPGVGPAPLVFPQPGPGSRDAVQDAGVRPAARGRRQAGHAHVPAAVAGRPSERRPARSPPAGPDSAAGEAAAPAGSAPSPVPSRAPLGLLPWCWAGSEVPLQARVALVLPGA